MPTPSIDQKLAWRRNPYEAGYQREDFPEIWGWEEIVRYSGRHDTGVRELRGQFSSEFPEPIAWLSCGPVYLALEIKEFFLNHPRQRAKIGEEEIREIQGLIDGGMSRVAVAEHLGLHLNTVAKQARAPRI